MEERLRELQREFKRGQKQYELLTQQRTDLRNTLLRISGAIQVLEELLAKKKESPPQDPLLLPSSNFKMHAVKGLG